MFMCVVFCSFSFATHTHTLLQSYVYIPVAVVAQCEGFVIFLCVVYGSGARVTPRQFPTETPIQEG